MADKSNKPGGWEPPDRYVFTCYMQELIRKWHAATLQVIREDEDNAGMRDVPLIQSELRTALYLYQCAIAGWSDLDELLDGADFPDERGAEVTLEVNLAQEHVS